MPPRLRDIHLPVGHRNDSASEPSSTDFEESWQIEGVHLAANYHAISAVSPRGSDLRGGSSAPVVQCSSPAAPRSDMGASSRQCGRTTTSRASGTR